jgi:hypothetical protein
MVIDLRQRAESFSCEPEDLPSQQVERAQRAVSERSNARAREPAATMDMSVECAGRSAYGVRHSSQHAVRRMRMRPMPNKKRRMPLPRKPQTADGPEFTMFDRGPYVADLGAGLVISLSAAPYTRACSSRARQCQPTLEGTRS